MALPRSRIALLFLPLRDRQRDAVMKSMRSSAITWRSSGIESGGYVPSPSIVAMMSSRAAAKPVLYARPSPLRGSNTTRAPSARATAAVPSVDALSTTTTSSTSGGICSRTARMPASSLWHGITTEMRLPRYMRPSSPGLRVGGDRLARRGRAAGSERRACRRAPGEPPPGAAQLEARPFLQHRRQHAGVEEDVDGEEALVGAEALRLADEPPRLLRRRAEPDAAEVVAALAHVAELAVDQQLARVHVAVGEHRAPEVPGVARNLVLVGAHDLRDEVVADDPLGVDEVGERERVVAGERPRLVLPLHVVGVGLVLLDVEELRERLLRAAPGEQRKDRVDVEVLAEPLVVLDEHVLVVLRDGGFHLHAAVLVVLLEVAQRLVGLHRPLEEAGKHADLVVQRPHPVERHVDVEVEVGTGFDEILHDRHGACRGAPVGRDPDVPHSGVLVEDLDDLADVLAQEGLAAGRQKEHEAALADARRDLVDLFEVKLLAAIGHRRLLPSGVGAVGEQTVLALRVAGVGDEVHEVHGQLPALEEHLLPVLEVLPVAHRIPPSPS